MRILYSTYCIFQEYLLWLIQNMGGGCFQGKPLPDFMRAELNVDYLESFT